MKSYSTELDINFVFAEILPGCFSLERKQAGSRTSQMFLASSAAPAMESVGKNRNDRAPVREHAGNSALTRATHA